jgi:hypothetical protein
VNGRGSCFEQLCLLMLVRINYIFCCSLGGVSLASPNSCYKSAKRAGCKVACYGDYHVAFINQDRLGNCAAGAQYGAYGQGTSFASRGGCVSPRTRAGPGVSSPADPFVET